MWQIFPPAWPRPPWSTSAEPPQSPPRCHICGHSQCDDSLLSGQPPLQHPPHPSWRAKCCGQYCYFSTVVLPILPWSLLLRPLWCLLDHTWTRVYSWNTYPAEPLLRYEHIPRHARSIPRMFVFLHACNWVTDSKYRVQTWKGWSQETDNRK